MKISKTDIWLVVAISVLLEFIVVGINLEKMLITASQKPVETILASNINMDAPRNFELLGTFDDKKESIKNEEKFIAKVEPAVELEEVTEMPEEIAEDSRDDLQESAEIVEEVVESTRYFDVPLSHELQEHIFKLCEERDIDPALIVSMIWKESRFNADTVGDSGKSLGLMQVQPRWHKARMEKYGCDNLLDPFQNVTIGIDIIDGLIDSDMGIEWALMAYNGGAGYASKKRDAGEVSDYAKNVLNFMDTL